jgi:hypothetical protein
MQATVQLQREIGSFCGRRQANVKPVVVISDWRL